MLGLAAAVTVLSAAALHALATDEADPPNPTETDSADDHWETAPRRPC